MRQRQWSLLLVGMLLIGMLPLEAAAAPPSKGTHKLIVQNSDTAALKALAQSGGKQLADYGSFSLWQAPEIQAQTVTGRSSVAVRDDLNTIQLRGVTLDTTTGTVAPVATNVRQGKTTGKQFWMVQFVGPIKSEWLDNLKKLGIEIVGYVPNNAYVIWLDGNALTQLESLAKTDPTIQWTGEYHPQYRLAPAFRGAKAPQSATLTPVTVQFYNTPTVQTSVDAVRALGGAVLRQPQTILDLVDISLELPANQLMAIAGRADVFNVEPYNAPKKNDEAQGQIVAGNVTTSGANVVPQPPGYLTFLNGKGFPTDPTQYPIVAVADDGVDIGTTTPLHPDFYKLGNPANPADSRLVASFNCTTNPSAAGNDGHGNINAGIVGGYNDKTGFPYEDANGYQYGLGISPYGRLANIKIFRDGGAFDESQCGNTDAGTVLKAYMMGALITSNSWGNDDFGAYSAEAQAYDTLTRDASSGTAGNQEMLHVFAAGNDGPGTQSVSSPGTAKNVLAVGATENVREDGVPDGCVGDTSDHNADNMADFSGRGPTSDGRAKPDIVAPGTHIQGPASQAPGYNGSGVCGGDPTISPDPRYHPNGQTLYTWSSGTSHSTPAISGVASLVYNYYERIIKPGTTPPSPAMAKALILNSPRYLNGLETGDNLPSPNQGWGDTNLTDLFDNTTHRYVVDQTTTFTSTGETFVKGGTVTNGSKPLKVTLVWTDAPGSTIGAATVNDLNLEVTIDGHTYKGNVFNHQWSTPDSGSADTLNNVENVFIQSPAAGHTFSVKVTAANIAGIAIPGGVGTVNQDFALVISNGDVTPSAALGFASINATDSGPGSNGNGNGFVDPGETIAVTVGITNGGDAAATGVSGTLSSSSSTVTIGGASATYGTIAPNATATNTPAFTFTLALAQVCGQQVPLSETLTYNGGQTTTISFSLNTGTPLVGSPATYAYPGPAIPIPDDSTTGATAPIAVNGSGTVTKLRVTVNITHPFDGDLSLRLFAPNGSSISLSAQNGDAGDNYTSTVFDDDAATPITAGTPPFTGTFKPEQPLANLNGAPVNGMWRLFVQDGGANDIGTLDSWQLEITPRIATCQVFPPVAVTGIAPTTGPTAGGTAVIITGVSFLSPATVTFGSDHVPATAVQVPNTTTIAVIAPAHAAGTVDVTVTTDGATITLPHAYTYGAVSPVPPVRSDTPPGTPPAPVPSGRSGSATGDPPAPIPSPRP